MKPRLLLADDHTLLLEGIRLLLEPEFDLVGSVEDGQALLTARKGFEARCNPSRHIHAAFEWNRRSTSA
jgi:CheY-like chemotaxis protein